MENHQSICLVICSLNPLRNSFPCQLILWWSGSIGCLTDLPTSGEVSRAFIYSSPCYDLSIVRTYTYRKVSWASWLCIPCHATINSTYSSNEAIVQRIIMVGKYCYEKCLISWYSNSFFFNFLLIVLTPNQDSWTRKFINQSWLYWTIGY